MRIGKRSPLLLGAIVAFILALPATALAGEWTVEGEPLTEEQAIEVAGTYAYETGYGSFHCTIQGEATLVPGSEGEISNLVATSNPCEGNFLGCGVSVVFDTPWPIEARTEDVFVTETFEEWPLSCEPFTVYMEGTITLTPDNPEAISSFDLYGEREDAVTHIPLVATGELEVTPAGVYGIK